MFTFEMLAVTAPMAGSPALRLQYCQYGCVWTLTDTLVPLAMDENE
ncbi:MAG: hypothetical protein JO370_13460 [Paucibacter sp.]|nr:hypothetical protein [Roseateles sp.]